MGQRSFRKIALLALSQLPGVDRRVAYRSAVAASNRALFALNGLIATALQAGVVILTAVAVKRDTRRPLPAPKPQPAPKPDPILNSELASTLWGPVLLGGEPVYATAADSVPQDGPKAHKSSPRANLFVGTPRKKGGFRYARYAGGGLKAGQFLARKEGRKYEKIDRIPGVVGQPVRRRKGRRCTDLPARV